ncbi:hypothetical protein HUW62_00135 [Myxococcus sp. AM011]|uniref:RHS repeat-associated core domain-containing protein n=1 Tax=Myxococcus sp. AM011 TaxID=2745200 RepID=UPI00159580C5|nr:RHS repeat-associated core domain-containing protein [Myxococcus sp. AM011]NVJ19648.1 hypothetical protein [Myxococcus sp. AM011]
MKWTGRTSWLCIAVGLVIVVVPVMGAAQLAPTGGHYAGRASDTGAEPGMVNLTGGYVASVPLDLPVARGGMPVPLAIRSGAQGTGAAGVGWDIPLSYIRRDTGYAHRKPQMGSNVAPAGREQVTLMLQGQAISLFPKTDQTWVARHDAADLVLREQGGIWVMYDGRGRTWNFIEPSQLAGSGLWLLSTVTGADSTAVKLDYDVSTVSVPGGDAVSLDLRRVSYNRHPQSDCYKHEVGLNYGPSATSPLSLSLLGDRVLTRMRILERLDVESRDTCTGSKQRLHSYAFTYQPDADTRQQRLSSVKMYGRQGTPEELVALPVVAFGYGSATTNNKLAFKKTQIVSLPAGPDATRISATARDGTFAPPVAAGTGSATWQSLTDVTGDGLPDLVYPKNGKLWVAVNRPATSSTISLGTGTFNAQLSDTVLTTGAFETRSATQNRFANSSAAVNIDKVWRQAIDVNGDGRVDLIDAAAEPGRWVIYLNTPGAGPSGVTWVRRSFSIGNLYTHLLNRGHNLTGNYLPLSSRFSGRERVVGTCWKFIAGTGWTEYPQGYTTHECNNPDAPSGELSADAEKTYTDWEVKDVNGDGFPDFVFNSSRVDVVPSFPSIPGTPNQVFNAPRRIWVRPLQDTSNKVEAVLNLYGLAIEEGSPVFSAPITLLANTECGVGLWTTTGDTQSVLCGLAEVNGDGLLDRFDNRTTVRLGTGRGFSPVTLTLPGPYSVQKTAQNTTCVAPNPAPPGATTFGAAMNTGLRDLTGDGIPDFVSVSGSTWTVAIGTGAGFALPAVTIEVEGSGFTLSSVTDQCDGLKSFTTSGLYDINGDGKPDVVRLNGSSLDVYELYGPSRRPGKPEAGRIVQVDNGHGAITGVSYRSAKQDGTTKHQVPFPEIVVTSVGTGGTLGLGGDLSPTLYAYGGAELMYDSALQAFTLPAYQRSVVVRAPTEKSQEGYATITDTYPLPALSQTSKLARFSRYLLAGKTRDITLLTGVATDAWGLLSTDVATSPRRVGGTHFEWTAKLFEETPVPGNTNQGLDCFEMAYPLDFLASWLANTNRYDTCSSRGFIYQRSAESWRGQAAPPSANNVVTRSEALDVDDYGRVITVQHLNDAYQGDDDICVETKYAAPTGTGPRVLHAPMSRRFWNCLRPGLPTYASEAWFYDGLTSGSVSAGHLTSHSRERRDVNTGALLNTVLEYTASYDAAGNPSIVTRVREDGAVRKVTLTYDTFGLAQESQRVDATGVPALGSIATLDPFTLDTLSTLDPNQTRLGTDFDGYGRVVRTTMTPPGGALGVRSTTSFLGFTGGDPLGWRVVHKSFIDAVPSGTEGSATGQVAIEYLDELGRSRRTEGSLGASYGNDVMISGAKTYDALGRVVFEADPYPASQNGATAYGTTHFFNVDGTPLCVIRGHGPQAYSNVTDEAAERYPACYARSFADHLETHSVRDAASLLSTSPQAGVIKSATMTGAGRLLSRSTWKSSSRLEYATFTHDRLGQLTSMTRYQDPATFTVPVQWTWAYDSFGQRIQWTAPDTTAQTVKYSNWGEPLETSWNESISAPTGPRLVVSRYDALGRLTHQEQRVNGTVDSETVNDFLYDTGSSPTSLVTPRNLLGRLSTVLSPTGGVFYSYDALGRQEAQVYTDDVGYTYVQKSWAHGDGSLASLAFYLPDTGFSAEWVDYTYDSARRLNAIHYSDRAGTHQLYQAKVTDVFGRVRESAHADDAVRVDASYADVGRRLLNEATVHSSFGSRRIIMLGYDAMGREKSRREIVDGAASGPKTNVGYDALGRLASSLRTDGSTTLTNWQYTYDALGNLVNQNDLVGTSDVAISVGAVDRDRLCRIGYNTSAGSSPCNVGHDSQGNVIDYTSRTGWRRVTYAPSGDVRSIEGPPGTAVFRYGAFGSVRKMELNVASADAKAEWKLGGLIERKEQKIGGVRTEFVTRHIPGPGGIVATRRGVGDDWAFHFGETRGARFMTDLKGIFVQDIDYQPFGEAKSTGSAQPGTLLYTSSQWNWGDALAPFNLSQLGARLYDPALGRFLSRDPLTVPRTSATTNPYAFAMNDPLNLSDPTGLDPCGGGECQGGGGGGGGDVPGGGPSVINDPDLYIVKSLNDSPDDANPQSAYRPVPTATFSLGPSGAQTVGGFALRTSIIALTGIVMDDSYSFDSLAAAGTTVEEALILIANTEQGAEAAVAAYNARLDKISSFSAGVGDNFIFWCPGCTQNMRNTWLGPSTSGDANGKYRLLGSLVGMIGSFMVPSPKGAPQGNVAAELRAQATEVFVKSCRGRGNCGYYAIALHSTRRGVPMAAIDGEPMTTDFLAAYFKSTWVETATRRAVTKAMKSWGEGSEAIVSGALKSTGQGHAFNAVFSGGKVYFVDATKPWVEVNLKNYSNIWILRSH